MYSKGHEAYNADLAITPTYHDGTPRPTWEQLPEYAQWSWERNPTPRKRVTHIKSFPGAMVEWERKNK